MAWLDPVRFAWVLATVSALLLFGALGFQYIGEMPPCALCLYQRYPHILAIGIAAIAIALGPGGEGRSAQLGLIALAGTALAGGTAVAGFHVGVEQKWWAGIQACGGGLTTTGLSLEALRDQLMRTPIVRCDRVPWELFGISLAGFNFLISLALAVSSAWAIALFRARRTA